METKLLEDTARLDYLGRKIQVYKETQDRLRKWTAVPSLPKILNKKLRNLEGLGVFLANDPLYLTHEKVQTVNISVFHSRLPMTGMKKEIKALLAKHDIPYLLKADDVPVFHLPYENSSDFMNSLPMEYQLVHMLKALSPYYDQ